MKFAHMADCHIGGWRDPLLSELGDQAFVRAVSISIAEKVDFVLISGDLFNTSLPAIDRLKLVVEQLRLLKDAGIRTYTIPGSHDFSPSGRTMLDVLESAGLCRSIVRGDVAEGRLRLEFTADPCGAKIAGMLGRKGSLERRYYEDLDRAHLEKEQGFKIFMFHTALSEFKTVEHMDSAPLSLLPRGFSYYAAGHVHERMEHQALGGIIVYPGPLFPNSFKELEDLRHGGFYIWDGRPRFMPIELKKVAQLVVDCEGRTPEEVEQMLTEQSIGPDSIVTMRLAGRLASGRVTDIGFRQVFRHFSDQGAYAVLKNTSALTSPEFTEVKVHEESVEAIEQSLIAEQGGDVALTGKLMQALDQAKGEGERTADFEARVIKAMDSLLGL